MVDTLRPKGRDNKVSASGLLYRFRKSASAHLFKVGLLDRRLSRKQLSGFGSRSPLNSEIGPRSGHGYTKIFAAFVSTNI